MQRTPFDRALEFLGYSRRHKIVALTASIATGGLYVVLVALLALFVDLGVHRGNIPCYASLPHAAASAFAARVQLSAEATPRKEEVARLVDWVRDLGIDAPQVERLVASEAPDQLSTRDRELRRAAVWMGETHLFLKLAVGLDAAEAFRKSLQQQASDLGVDVALQRNLDDFGLLALVVRTRDASVRRSLLAPFVRFCGWTWRGGNLPYLRGLLLCGLLVASLRALGFYVGHRAAARATVDATQRLRRAVYLQTYRLGAVGSRAGAVGEAIGVFTRRVEAVREGLFVWLTTHFREPVKLACLVLLALLLDFWLALAFVVFAAVVWIAGGQIATAFQSGVRLADLRTAEQLSLAQESLRLVRLAKAYLMEAFNQRRFDAQLAAHAAAQENRHRNDAVQRPVFAILAMLAILVLAYLTGSVVLHGNVGAVTALTMFATLASLYWPASVFIDNRRQLHRAHESAETLFEFLDRTGSVGQAGDAEFLPILKKAIVFDDVSVQDPGDGRMLLRKLSFQIASGQKTAIVGADEDAKHAIVSLLPRFLDPSQGEVRFDNKNLRWVTLDSLRVQIALVTQNHLVFNDTVANNIGCGDSAYAHGKIVEAAKLVHAHHFISKLPQGYATPIGELGHALDLGERYRIALARAVLRDPSLLVIEEPHDPLDPDTKAMVDDAYQRMFVGRTVLFLPHRLATLRACDWVYFLHEGAIADQGDHRDLLQNNDLYRHLLYLEFNEFAHSLQPAE